MEHIDDAGRDQHPARNGPQMKLWEQSSRSCAAPGFPRGKEPVLLDTGEVPNLGVIEVDGSVVATAIIGQPDGAKCPHALDHR